MLEVLKNEWLNAVAIRDWMDAVVESRQRENQLKRFGNQILLLDVSETVHVDSQIGEMASAAGSVLKEEFRGDHECPYKYSFTYRGMKFFQISEERLEGYM